MTETSMIMKGTQSELSATIYEYNNIVRVVYTLEYTTRQGNTCERTYDVKKTTKEQAINYLSNKGFIL